MNTNANGNANWTEIMAKAFASARREQGKAEGIVPSLAIDTVLPFITQAQDMGSIQFRADSAESIKAVTEYVADSTGIGSTKSMVAGTQRFLDARADAANLKHAVKFLAACKALEARHQHVLPDYAKGLFPIIWTCPTAVEYDSAGEQMVPTVKLRKLSKARQSVSLDNASNEQVTFQFDMTLRAIMDASAIQPKAQRKPKAPGTTDASSGTSNGAGAAGTDSAAPILTLHGGIIHVASALARDDYKVSGDSADAFFDLVEAFCAASENNRAAVLAIVQQSKPTMIEGEAAATA